MTLVIDYDIISSPHITDFLVSQPDSNNPKNNFKITLIIAPDSPNNPNISSDLDMHNSFSQHH